MSLLSVAIAAISSNPSSSDPPRTHDNDDHTIRHNEHLAVLLPKHLWKSDHLATRCDRFGCQTSFTIFERRHHCRKCGGIFCSACSSRTTRLLDTSLLDFFHPPRGIPISDFDSPESPVIGCRICDDCWDQIHGLSRFSRSPESSPLCSQSSTPSLCSTPLSPLSSGQSSLCNSILASPPKPLLFHRISRRKTRSLHTASSASSIEGSAPVNSSKRMSIRHSRLPLPVELSSERSYGELDAYPLRRSSVLCKATGGGRWEPKQSPVYAGYRPPIPGGKAPFEIEMENEEREARLRRENPVVKDGEFRYRFSREPEPVILSQSPYHIATF